MFYSDDPIRDFLNHDAELARQLELRPVCADCCEPIQEEEAYYINGEWICERCIDSYKREVMPE